MNALHHRPAWQVCSLAVLCLIACSGSHARPKASGANPQVYGAVDASLSTFIAQLDQTVPRLLAQGSVIPGAAVALVHNGQLAWSHGYGWADPEQQQPLTPDTAFVVGSIAKSLTAWGVMRLAEDGKLDLDAPVEQYLTTWHLPPAAGDSRQVTARRLLSHTAGITDGPQLDRARSVQDALRDLAIVAPGTFRYSNDGYLILQLLIEAISHEPFADYMRHAVLAPLQLTAASYQVGTVANRLAAGYSPTTKHPAGERVPRQLAVLRAVGGLYATAPAIAQFVAAAMPGPAGEPPGRGVLQPGTVAQMLTPAPGTAEADLASGANAYGLGYGLNTVAGDVRVALHGGIVTGWLSLYAFLPDRGEGIVILTNGDGGYWLVRRLMCAWLSWAAPGGTIDLCGSFYGIYLVEADGSGARPAIVRTAPTLYPRWSPDGSRLAFHSTPFGAGFHVYTARTDGADEQHLAGALGLDAFADWAPDGRRIAFSSDRDGPEAIYVMGADGSGQRRLSASTAQDTLPAWSPDGTRIAFLRRSGASTAAGYTLWVMHADGSEAHALVDDVGEDGAPAWSPDGSRIAFTRDGDIYVISVEGGRVVRLTQDGNGNAFPTWSPDGVHIAFAAGPMHHHDLEVMNADGSGRAVLVADGADSIMPAWSPDGQRLAFASNRLP